MTFFLSSPLGVIGYFMSVYLVCVFNLLQNDCLRFQHFYMPMDKIIKASEKRGY